MVSLRTSPVITVVIVFSELALAIVSVGLTYRKLMFAATPRN